MDQPLDTLKVLRDRTLSWGIKILPVAGFFLLLVSLQRAFTIGWQPVMGLHIFFYLAIIVTAFFNHRLPFLFRAVLIIAIPFILGTFGLMTWGLAGLGFQSLFVSCILATILFGGRTGIMTAGLSTVIIGTAWMLFGTGILKYDFDLQVYFSSYPTWLSALFTMGLSVGLIVKGIGTLDLGVNNLVQTLQNQNTEMSGIIHRLETEMAEHARLEKERRELEARLQRAERMEALGTLAGGVAHDLNNLLVGAVSYPDLILAQLPEGSPLKRPIEMIQRSGVKAAAIVEDLLTLARRGVISTQVINPNSIIEDYFTSPEYQKLKSFHPDVEVELRLDQNLPNILGSSIHLHKTIMNLVSNAAEAMSEGGKIIVSTRKEHTGPRTGLIDLLEEGEYVILTVSDTGAGISADDIVKIFEPFYTKKVMGRSGTGLGMAVVWGTVKDHKGHIDIESTIGKGTTITLYFPTTEEKLVQTPSDLPAKEWMGKGESILIVDDIKEQREMVIEMFRELGYSVNAAASGEEAVTYLEKSSADLIILDMYMDPGMDGLDTYRKMLNLNPRQKAVITSGYAETWRVKEAQKLGAGTYIRKPFFLNEIGVAVRTELDK